MIARTWIVLAMPLTLMACSGDKDDGTTSPQDTGPTTGDTVPDSPLEAFDVNDWWGTCTRSDGVEFVCEADLDYDEGADNVTGTMDIDALWTVTFTEGDDGVIGGQGTGLLDGQFMDFTNMAVSDDGELTGDWSWDFGDGTLSMVPGGPM